MKRAEVLIVEDMNGEKKLDEKNIAEILEKINGADEIIVNKVTLPINCDNEDLVGVHVIVREIAET